VVPAINPNWNRSNASEDYTSRLWSACAMHSRSGLASQWVICLLVEVKKLFKTKSLHGYQWLNETRVVEAHERWSSLPIKLRKLFLCGNKLLLPQFASKATFSVRERRCHQIPRSRLKCIKILRLDMRKNRQLQRFSLNRTR